jgi:hypothetical protein
MKLRQRAGRGKSAIDALPATPSFTMIGLLNHPEDEQIDEWYMADTIPRTFIEFALGLQTVLQEVVETIPGLQRNFGGQWAMTADDLRKVEVRLQMLESHQQAGRQTEDAQTAQAQTVAEVQKETYVMARRVQAAQADTLTVHEDVDEFKADLDSTLAIVLALKDWLDQLPVPPPGRISGGILGRSEEESSGRNAGVKEALEGLRTRVFTLEAQVAAADTVAVFRDIVLGIQTLDDMYAWVLGNFVPGEPPHDPYSFGALGEEEDAGLAPTSAEATFGPFPDIFVLVAHVEDLESHTTRMEMLKEMEVWEKAGLMQPGEASVAYTIKQTVPALRKEMQIASLLACGP